MSEGSALYILDDSWFFYICGLRLSKICGSWRTHMCRVVRDAFVCVSWKKWWMTSGDSALYILHSSWLFYNCGSFIMSKGNTQSKNIVLHVCFLAWFLHRVGVFGLVSCMLWNTILFVKHNFTFFFCVLVVRHNFVCDSLKYVVRDVLICVVRDAFMCMSWLLDTILFVKHNFTDTFRVCEIVFIVCVSLLWKNLLHSCFLVRFLHRAIVMGHVSCLRNFVRCPWFAFVKHFTTPVFPSTIFP